MVPVIATRGASFAGAFAYYCHDKKASTSERVAWAIERKRHDLEQKLDLQGMRTLIDNLKSRISHDGWLQRIVGLHHHRKRKVAEKEAKLASYHTYLKMAISRLENEKVNALLSLRRMQSNELEALQVASRMQVDSAKYPPNDDLRYFQPEPKTSP